MRTLNRRPERPADVTTAALGKPATLRFTGPGGLGEACRDLLFPPAAYLVLCVATFADFIPDALSLYLCFGGVAALICGTWLPRRRVLSIATSASVAFVLIVAAWLVT